MISYFLAVRSFFLEMKDALDVVLVRGQRHVEQLLVVKYDNYKETTTTNRDVSQLELVPFRSALLNRLL